MNWENRVSCRFVIYDIAHTRNPVHDPNLPQLANQFRFMRFVLWWGRGEQKRVKWTQKALNVFFNLLVLSLWHDTFVRRHLKTLCVNCITSQLWYESLLSSLDSLLRGIVCVCERKHRKHKPVHWSVSSYPCGSTSASAGRWEQNAWLNWFGSNRCTPVQPCFCGSCRAPESSLMLPYYSGMYLTYVMPPLRHKSQMNSKGI